MIVGSVSMEKAALNMQKRYSLCLYRTVCRSELVGISSAGAGSDSGCRWSKQCSPSASLAQEPRAFPFSAATSLPGLKNFAAPSCSSSSPQPMVWMYGATHPPKHTPVSCPRLCISQGSTIAVARNGQNKVVLFRTGISPGLKEEKRF